MEVDSLVDYPSVTSIDRYSPTPYVRTGVRWGVSAVVPDVSMGEQFELASYTVDDIVVHNNQLGRRDWFKYGRRVYSLDQIKTVVQDASVFRKDEENSCNKDDTEEEDGVQELQQARLRCVMNALEGGYPIYRLRKTGVSRRVLRDILDQSVVGEVTDLENYTLLVRFKEWVEGTLQGIKQSENKTSESLSLVDFEDQLCRWLKDYPCVEKARYNPLINCVDHNDNFFPLPVQIMCNPLVLREWTDEWTPFDFKIPEEGVWHVKDLLNEDLGDVHEIFTDLLKSRVDDKMEDFDMEIEGEAAWNVIEDDIVKNDITTAEQDRILESRKQREHPADNEWMRKRRKQITTKLMQRHKWTQEKVEPYLTMCDHLENHWKTFQELC